MAVPKKGDGMIKKSSSIGKVLNGSKNPPVKKTPKKK